MAIGPRSNGFSPGPGRLNIAYTLIFVAFIIVMAVLNSIGVPDSVIGPVVVGATLASFIAIGISGRTMQADEFQLAGRSVPAAYNGMVGGANFLSTFFFLSLTGSLYLLGFDGLALILGCAGGFVLIGVLVAPHLRGSGARSVPDFLAIRYRSTSVRLIGVVVVLASCFVFGAAQIYGAAMIASHMLGIGFVSSIYLAVACILSASLLGGMRSVTVVQAAQFIVIAVAFLVPVAWMAAVRTGIPLPQLTYGQVLPAIQSLETAQSISPSYAAPFGHEGMDGWNFTLLVLCMMAGTASLPHVLTRYLTTSSAAAARVSVAWSLFFVLLILVTAPALAAFARWAMLELVASGLTPGNVAERAGWLLRWGSMEGAPVTVCGDPARDLIAITAACAEQGIGEIRLSDIHIAPEAVVLAAPDMFGLPYMATALVATGAIAAALASAQGLLLSCAHALSHDVYSSAIDPGAPTARRLAISRALLLAVTACAGYLATAQPVDLVSIVLWSFALAAAGLFPALVLGIWWKNANAAGAAAGMVAGFGICLYYLLSTRYGAVSFYENWGALSSATAVEAARFDGLKSAWEGASGEAKAVAWSALEAHARTIANWWGVQDVSAAAFGLPAGFLVTVAVSHLARRRGSRAVRDDIDPVSSEPA